MDALLRRFAMAMASIRAAALLTCLILAADGARHHRPSAVTWRLFSHHSLVARAVEVLQPPV